MDQQRTKQLIGLGLAEAKAEALSKLCEVLVEKAAGGVTGLVLYGSAARGRYVPGSSDINLAIILRDGAPTTLQALAGPLREAYRTLRVEPFLLTADEVKHGADVFPTKFHDIAQHHVALYGVSPFSGLTVSRAHLRLRLEQELRNLSLRLRRRYVALVEEPETLARAISELVPGFAIELTGLLQLLGKPAPASDVPDDVLAAAAAAFDWPQHLVRAAQPTNSPRSAEQIRVDAEALMAAVASAASHANHAPEAV
jgi:predicted nucleotidyltransferase